MDLEPWQDHKLNLSNHANVKEEMIHTFVVSKTYTMENDNNHSCETVIRTDIFGDFHCCFFYD